MLNAVSSGSRFANVTPVRWGDRSSNSCGSRERPHAPSAVVVPNNRIGNDDRWPLRFGSLTTTPRTPGSLTSGATGRVADSRLAHEPELNRHTDQHPHRAAMHTPRTEQRAQHVVPRGRGEAWVWAFDHYQGPRLGAAQRVDDGFHHDTPRDAGAAQRLGISGRRSREERRRLLDAGWAPRAARVYTACRAA